MFVPRRKKGEAILLGDDIEVSVISIRGDSVRLGIVAPRSLPVHRREVYESIRRESTNGED